MAKKGETLSAEFRARLSASAKASKSKMAHIAYLHTLPKTEKQIAQVNALHKLPRTERFRKAVSDAAKNKSTEHREKLRKQMVESNLTRPHSAEQREASGKRLREYSQNKTAEHRKKLSEHLTHLNKTRPRSIAEREASSRRLSARRKQGAKETSIERKVRDILRESGVNFSQEHYFEGIGAVDFYVPESGLVIECDGTYWHGLDGAKERDARKDEKLIALQMRILRLPQVMIEKDDARTRSLIHYGLAEN